MTGSPAPVCVAYKEEFLSFVTRRLIHWKIDRRLLRACRNSPPKTAMKAAMPANSHFVCFISKSPVRMDHTAPTSSPKTHRFIN